VSQAIGLLVVVTLVAASAYFVAVEFSFTAANRNRLLAAQSAGDRKATAALKVLKRLSFCLSGAQIGITFAALLTGFVAQDVFAALLEPLLSLAEVPEGRRGAISLGFGFVISTFGLMVLGELAPQNLAIAIPEVTARRLARSTLLFLRLGGPVIRLFDGSANRLLRLFGITPIQEAHGTVTSEDLAQIIGTSGTAGHLTPEESGLLARALDFGELTAADVMVPRPQVTTLPEDACGKQLRDILSSTGLSRVPLVREATETVVGVVSVKAFLSLPPEQRDDAPVGPLASEVLRLPDTAPLAQVVAQMRRGRTQFAVAVDETGADVGVLTLEDVVEELVGEVRDEYDRVEPPPPADAAVVRGSLHLHEVARQTGVDLPDGDYDTVAGLVLAELGRLAQVGDEVTVAATRKRSDEDLSPRLHVTLRVDSLDGRRVGDVHLAAVPEAEEQS